MNKELYAALQNRLMKLSLKEKMRLSFKYGVSLKHLAYYAHDQSMHTRKDYIAAGFEPGGPPQLPGFVGRNVQFASRGTGAGGGGTRVTRAGARKVGAGKGARKVVPKKAGSGKGKSLTQKINAHNNARAAFEAEQNILYGTMKPYIKDMMKEWDTRNPAPTAKTRAAKTPAPAPAAAAAAETTPAGTTTRTRTRKPKPAGTTTRKPKLDSDTPAKLTPAQKFRARINLIKSGDIKELTPKQIAKLTTQQRKEYRETVRAAKIEATETARVEAAATKKVAAEAKTAKKVTDAKAKDDAQKKDDALGVNSSKWKPGQKPKTDADFEAERLFKAKDNPYKINSSGKLTKATIEQLKKDIEENFKQGSVYNVNRSFQELIPMYKRLPNGDRNPAYDKRAWILMRELDKLKKEFKDNGDSFAAKGPTAPTGGPSAPAGGPTAPTAPTAPNAPAGKRDIQIKPAPVVQGRLKKVLDEVTKGSVETKSTWRKIAEFFVDPRGFIDRAKLNFYERGWQSTPQKQQALAQAQYLVNQMTPLQVTAFLVSRGAGSSGTAATGTAEFRRKVEISLNGKRILENADNANKDLAIQILAQERWGDITLRAGNSPLVRLPVPPAPSFGPRDGQGGRGRGGTAPSPPAKPSTRKPPPKPPTLRSPGKPGTSNDPFYRDGPPSTAIPLPRVGGASTAIPLPRVEGGSTAIPLPRVGGGKPIARPQDNVPAQPKGIIGIPAGITIAQDRKRLQELLVSSGWVGAKRPAPAGSLVDLPASSAFQRIQNFIKGKP